MTQYSLVENNGFKNLTVFVGGELHSITGDHPKFSDIVARLLDGEEIYDIADLISPAKAINEHFEKVSEQIAIKNGQVLFEGSEVHDVITDHIVDHYENGSEDYKPLVKFLEKLKQNPNQHSVDQLYRWLNAQGMTITDDGDIVGYKGVSQELLSQHSGDGIVDGVQYKNTQLPNSIGSIVEMPRDNVTFDPATGCSYGLHAGTWGYANGFGRRTLEVHINPRDVVSVPSDCESQKMRTCRYKVIQELEKPYEATVIYGYSDDEDEDEDYGNCYNCGAPLREWEEWNDYCDSCEEDALEDELDDPIDDEDEDEDEGDSYDADAGTGYFDSQYVAYILKK